MAEIQTVAFRIATTQRARLERLAKRRGYQRYYGGEHKLNLSMAMRDALETGLETIEQAEAQNDQEQ